MDDDLFRFKTDRELREWSSGSVFPLLMTIVTEAGQYAYYDLGFQLLITSIWRSVAEDADLGGHGIHPEWRAVDVHADSWQDTKIGQVASFVEGRYQYDPSRPSMKVALWEPHGNGPHLHLQVHPATRLRVPPLDGAEIVPPRNFQTT